MILDMVVRLLHDNGIRAEAAQPAGNMTAALTTVAAVSLECVDQAKESATIVVEMVGPVTEGAKICQKRALKALDILSAAGGVCRQEKCTFLSKADMFCTPITAVFYGIASAEDWQPHPGYTVTIAGAPLAKVTAFSSQQRQGDVLRPLTELEWEFSLEEFLPVGVQEPADPTEPFVLTVSYGSGSETYTGCSFITRERVAERNGIRQVRRGTAEQRTGNK
jgi:hypothetical protein